MSKKSFVIHLCLNQKTEVYFYPWTLNPLLVFETHQAIAVTVLFFKCTGEDVLPICLFLLQIN